MIITQLQEIATEPYVTTGHIVAYADAITDPDDVAETVASFATVAPVEPAKGWGPYNVILVTTDSYGNEGYWLAAVADDEDDRDFDDLRVAINIVPHKDGRTGYMFNVRARVTVTDSGALAVELTPSVPWDGEAPTFGFTGRATLADVLDALSPAIAYPPDESGQGRVIFHADPR